MSCVGFSVIYENDSPRLILDAYVVGKRIVGSLEPIVGVTWRLEYRRARRGLIGDDEGGMLMG